MAARLRELAAKSSGDQPYLLRILTLPPAPISASRAATWPWNAATCTAEVPRSSREFTFAPRLRRSFNMPMCLERTKSERGAAEEEDRPSRMIPALYRVLLLHARGVALRSPKTCRI